MEANCKDLDEIKEKRRFTTGYRAVRGGHSGLIWIREERRCDGLGCRDRV